jgi:hypothetical protein
VLDEELGSPFADQPAPPVVVVAYHHLQGLAHLEDRLGDQVDLGDASATEQALHTMLPDHLTRREERIGHGATGARR